MLSTKAIKIELKHNSKFQNTEIERRITGENRAERIEEWKYNHLMTSQLTIVYILYLLSTRSQILQK